MSGQSIEPHRFEVELSDGVIAGWRWPNEDAPPLLFCHATGFCASSYKKLLAAVSSAYDVYAIDLRGHGRTQLPADPSSLKSWRTYVDDIGRFLDQADRRAWTLAGHSMGGATAATAALGRQDIAAIKLIEPVTPPWVFDVLARTPFWRPLASQTPMPKAARARRRQWPDREAALSRYRRKPIFAKFAQGVLEDYLEDGARASDDGVMLSCDPAWEAATFTNGVFVDFWPAVRQISAPITVLASTRAGSTVSPSSIKRFRQYGAIVRETEAFSHLVPMESPSSVAHFLLEGDPN